MTATDDPGAPIALERAVATLAAIQHRRLYDRRRKLYGRRRLSLRRSYEYLWPFADTLSAVGTLASLDGQHEASIVATSLLNGLRHYSRRAERPSTGAAPVSFESEVVPPLGSGGDVYYDDNAWLALALLNLDGDDREPALALAERLFAFVLGGWSGDDSWSHPGGIRWKEPTSNVSRNTCSNGPVVELAVLIHQRTGDPGTLEWALRIYDWVRSALLGPDDLYVDQIAPDGTLNHTVWSYNQGVMIGAGVLLDQLTGDHRYLEHAEATAAAAAARFDLDSFMTQEAAFNAVYFRNILMLDRVSPDPARAETAAAYGEAMWTRARQRRTGLFPRGGSPLNSSAPMIEIYALCAGAHPHP